MTDILPAIWLGIVEGLTEFLPVSSTGHLIITGNLLGVTGPKADTFEVVIQLGAILAVVVLYWERFLALLKPRADMRFSGFRGLWLLFLTSLPASLAGLLLHGAIKEHLFTPVTVGLALGVGALYILFVENRTAKQGEPDKYATLDDITPSLALGIGFPVPCAVARLFPFSCHHNGGHDPRHPPFACGGVFLHRSSTHHVRCNRL